MSSATLAHHQKHEWIVILPDRPDVLQKRMQVRAEHLKEIHYSKESGFWKLGGAILEETVKEGEDPKIKGSIMLALAESKDDVLKALRKDIYFKEDVWDWDKVQIYPATSLERQRP